MEPPPLTNTEENTYPPLGVDYPPLRKPLELQRCSFRGFRFVLSFILGRFWVLPSVAKREASVYQGFRLFVILHNVCFMVYNASISGTSCTNFSPRAYIELMFFSCYWQHFLLLPSTLLRTLCKHSFHLLTAPISQRLLVLAAVAKVMQA